MGAAGVAHTPASELTFPSHVADVRILERQTTAMSYEIYGKHVLMGAFGILETDHQMLHTYRARDLRAEAAADALARQPGSRGERVRRAERALEAGEIRGLRARFGWSLVGLGLRLAVPGRTVVRT
ncbi:hypothetical protein GA0115257_108939 [Streptomyces sp. LcepLS]|nr:hypothetical protein GA0115257_108939 [Streptomyces sp. LcepLS]